MAGGSSGAIRAGQAFVELATKDNLLIRGLKNAEQRVRAFGRIVASAGLNLSVAGGSLLAPITKAFDFAADRGTAFANMSDRFKVPVEKLSAMGYAFERGGLSLDEFGATMDGLQAKMFAAADGADDLFIRLGINARGFAQLPLDKQFEQLLAHVNRLADPMDRAAVGTELFGDAWRKLSGTSMKSLETFKALAKEADAAGAVMSGKDARQARETTQALTMAWVELKSTLLKVGLALIPTHTGIKGFADAIRTAGQTAREWIARNRGLIVIAAATGAALVAGGVALYAFGTACTVVGAAVGGVVAVLGVFGVALKFLLTPFGLVLAAVAGLTVAWITLTDSGKRFAESFTATFRELGAVFSETWGGIVAALGSGNFELAGRVALAGLKAAWAEAMVFLTEQWVAFKDLVVDGFDDITDGLAKSMIGWRGYWTQLTEGEQAAVNQVHAELGVLDSDAKHREKENRKFRQKQIDDARAERDRLRAELADFTRQAHKTGKSPDEIEKSMWNPEEAEEELRRQQSQLYQASKGTFSGSNLSGMLGYGDNIGQRALKVAERQLNMLDRIRDEIANLQPVAFK